MVPPTSDEHAAGAATDPDNTYQIVNYGDDPPGHAGSFVFGTEHDMVDRGEEMGTYDGDYSASSGSSPHTIRIPETTVTRSQVVRFEMCQSGE